MISLAFGGFLVASAAARLGDVTWTSLSSEPGISVIGRSTFKDAMPLGNGDLAALVWPNVTTGSLEFYLRKSDALHGDSSPFVLTYGRILFEESILAPHVFRSLTWRASNASVTLQTAYGSVELFILSSVNALVAVARPADLSRPLRMRILLTSPRPSTFYSFVPPFFCDSVAVHPDVVVPPADVQHHTVPLETLLHNLTYAFPLPSATMATGIRPFHRDRGVKSMHPRSSSLAAVPTASVALGGAVMHSSHADDTFVFAKTLCDQGIVSECKRAGRHTANRTSLLRGGGGAFASSLLRSNMGSISDGGALYDPLVNRSFAAAAAVGSFGQLAPTIPSTLFTATTRAVSAPPSAFEGGHLIVVTAVAAQVEDPSVVRWRASDDASILAWVLLRATAPSVIPQAVGGTGDPVAHVNGVGGEGGEPLLDGESLLAAHAEWWRAFWARSEVTLTCPSRTPSGHVADPCSVMSARYVQQRFLVAAQSRFEGGVAALSRLRMVQGTSWCGHRVPRDVTPPARGATDSDVASVGCAVCPPAKGLVMVTPPCAILPVKFNGQAYVAAQPPFADYRQWGAGDWWQNTRLPYGPLTAAGDVDEIAVPLLESYMNMMPSALARSSAFGFDGIFFTETKTMWGAYVPFGYSFNQWYTQPGFEPAGPLGATQPRSASTSLRATRYAAALSASAKATTGCTQRPAWIRGDMNMNPYTRYDRAGNSGGPELSWMLFSMFSEVSGGNTTAASSGPLGDVRIERYLPFALETLKYFMSAYPIRSSASPASGATGGVSHDVNRAGAVEHRPLSVETGREYVEFYPGQALETYWCAYPPSRNNCTSDDLPTIAALTSLADRVLALPPSLVCRGVGECDAAHPYASVDTHPPPTAASSRSTQSPSFRDQLVRWRAALPPLPRHPDGEYAVAALYPNATFNDETPQLYHVHPYRMVSVAEEAWGRVSVDEVAGAVQAFRNTPAAFKNGGWQQGIILSVRLGMTDIASRMMLERAATPPPLGYRFEGFAPHEEDYEPSADHYANLAVAMQEMFVQRVGYDGHAVVLPTWNCSWGGTASLHIPGAVVSVVVSAARHQAAWSVVPPTRRALVRVRNPCGFRLEQGETAVAQLREDLSAFL